MKKRLAFFAWFVIAALGCVALAGMGFSGMALSSRHKVAALGAGIVAVCALIGMIFPD